VDWSAVVVSVHCIDQFAAFAEQMHWELARWRRCGKALESTHNGAVPGKIIVGAVVGMHICKAALTKQGCIVLVCEDVQLRDASVKLSLEVASFAGTKKFLLVVWQAVRVHPV